MTFDWNIEKNNVLKMERNISFERIVVAIEENHLLDVLEHPNKERYPNQVLLIVDIDNYIYVVPCAIDKNIYFLKTIFANRKYTNEYLPNGRRTI